MPDPLVCAAMQEIRGTHSRHRCKLAKGHDPLWHSCPCGHVWRPEQKLAPLSLDISDRWYPR